MSRGPSHSCPNLGMASRDAQQVLPRNSAVAEQPLPVQLRLQALDARLRRLPLRPLRTHAAPVSD